MKQLRLKIRRVLSENLGVLPDDVMTKIHKQVEQETSAELEKRANSEKIINSVIQNIQQLKDKPNRTPGEQHVVDMAPELIKQVKYNNHYQAEFDEKAYRNKLTQMYVNLATRKIEDERATAEAMKKGLTKEDIVDQFVTALEGGSNYWYEIQNIPKDVSYDIKQNHIPFSEAIGSHILKGGYIQFHDVEDKNELLGTVTMDSILDAINTLKTEYPDIYTNIVLGDADASDADVFLQLCVMGEVVFG